MLKWIDLPPIWLAAFIFGAWIASPGYASGLVALMGSALVVLGVALMIWAIATMARAKTTVIPHQHATALVTNGALRFSRNPIYLGDALVLAGLLLRWNLWWALPVVAGFMWIIHIRFIVPEERRLRDDFGQAFGDYASRTRRWI